MGMIGSQGLNFFILGLKLSFNRQYQSIYLYCIRIHVLHHCCHLHHHPHGNQLCVYKSIYARGGGGWQRAGGCFGTPTPAFNPTCRCGAARGSPWLIQPRAHGQWWLFPLALPRAELPAVTRGVCLSVSPCPRLSVGGFDPPCAFHQTPSGAVWHPGPPDLVAGASLLVPCNTGAPAPLPFLARINWERFLPSLGGSLAQDPQPAPSCGSPEPPAPSRGVPKNPAKGRSDIQW